MLITKWFVSANYIGVFSFFLFVPRVLLATYIGILVDKSSNLKKLLLKSMLWTAIFMVAIIAVVAFEIKVFWILVILSVLYEVTSSFYLPILTKVIVILFARDELSNINSSITTAVTSANLFSGVVVTTMMKYLNLWMLLFFDLMLYSFSIIILMYLTVEKNEKNNRKKVKKTVNVLSEGIVAVRELLISNKSLAPVFYVALVFNIALAPQSVYFAELAHNVFMDLDLLGIFNTLFVSGFLLGSIFYRLADVRIKIHQFIIAALLLVPLSFLFLSLKNREMTCLGIILLGFAIPLYNISTKIILQTRVAKEKIATVSNSYYALLNVTQPIGLLGLPYIISLVGISVNLFLTSMFLFGITMVVLLFRAITSDLDLSN